MNPEMFSVAAPSVQKAAGLSIARVFTTAGVDPFSTVTWERRKAEIKGEGGKTVFVMEDVEVPTCWSQLALDIAADKYFRKAGVPGTGTEKSVRQMISRVVLGARTAGETLGGYFATPQDAQTFSDELTYILLHQIAAPNSPVWFNLGLKEAYGITGKPSGNWFWDPVTQKVREADDHYTHPAVSACFIISIKDDLMDIARQVEREMRVFRFGGGAGSNLSALRAEGEPLSNGGTSSGLMSWIPIFDKAAGATKSGGTTRRAARLVRLDADHPDIETFIDFKAKEEDKALALIRAGYPNDFNGEAYQTVGGQQANNSVGVTDEFMQAVINKGDWNTFWRTTKKVASTLKADKLFRKIAVAAHRCADPGLQFDTTINKWHTIPNAGKIEGSNPCCFVGETLVDTSEGMIEISKLEDMSTKGEALPLAFSFDLLEGLPVLRQIKKAWVAGKTKALVDVITSKGLMVRCTPEHRFLLRSGDYVEAKDLKPGMRLRKVGRFVNERRSSRRYLNHRTTDAVKNGTICQSRFMWQEVHGPIARDMDVHHKNDDPTDDRISNFELIPEKVHAVEHSTGSSNPRFIEVEAAALVETWEAIEATGKTTVARWNKHVRDNGLVGVVPLANTSRGIQGKTWEQFSAWIDENRELVNDKVLSVVKVALDKAVKVYDLEVDGVHNFGVRNKGGEGVHSVVVSNSEYMSISDSACNLGSVNLVKFLGKDGIFDTARFKHVCRVFTLAQEIFVDHASYPIQKIAENAHDYRQLGLGYANLGTLLMVQGIPYDSPKGRGIAAALTAILTGTGYETSAEIAEYKGSFPGYTGNRQEMLAVMEMHRAATQEISGTCPGYIIHEAVATWDRALDKGLAFGYRNSQASVIAPSGTIGLLMGCDTTGIEPEFMLVKGKKMAGGGYKTIANESVERALVALGYMQDQIAVILEHVKQTSTIEGAPELREDHLPVFDCANRCGKTGRRSIDPMGHIKMLEAVQPFVSGSISKTCNVPNEATVEEIEHLYMEAWKRGLKCIAIYRDGSKHSQPLNQVGSTDMTKAETFTAKLVESSEMLRANTNEPRSGHSPPKTVRHRLRSKRKGETYELVIGGQKVYLRTGRYEDGSLGELFVDLAKQGSTLGSLGSMFAIAVSLGLQHGVPLSEFVSAFTRQKFEPAGVVRGHDNVKMANSFIDAVFRVLAVDYLGDYELAQVKLDSANGKTGGNGHATATQSVVSTGPICTKCGDATTRTGTCYACLSCGTSSGGCS